MVLSCWKPWKRKSPPPSSSGRADHDADALAQWFRRTPHAEPSKRGVELPDEVFNAELEPNDQLRSAK